LKNVVFEFTGLLPKLILVLAMILFGFLLGRLLEKTG